MKTARICVLAAATVWCISFILNDSATGAFGPFATKFAASNSNRWTTAQALNHRELNATPPIVGRLLEQPEPKMFPKFNNSGVVVHYHIPKTGGTSIRAFFGRRHARVSSVRAYNASDLERYGQTIESILSGNETAILFLELHGEIPGIPELHDQYLQRWRSLSNSSGVPLFTFTLLREPVSFHRSYFRHFHIPRCRYLWCEKDTYEITEPNLVKSMQSDQQCRELLFGLREQKQTVALSALQNPERDCQQVQDLLLSDDWDWVGTTKSMQNVTLPVLGQVVFQDAALGRKARIQNSKKESYLTNLTHETIQYIQQQSTQDVQLYGYWSDRERQWQAEQPATTTVDR